MFKIFEQTQQIQYILVAYLNDKKFVIMEENDNNFNYYLFDEHHDETLIFDSFEEAKNYLEKEETYLIRSIIFDEAEEEIINPTPIIKIEKLVLNITLSSVE